jgi:hypothetical protein
MGREWRFGRGWGWEIGGQGEKAGVDDVNCRTLRRVVDARVGRRRGGGNKRGKAGVGTGEGRWRYLEHAALLVGIHGWRGVWGVGGGKGGLGDWWWEGTDEQKCCLVIVRVATSLVRVAMRVRGSGYISKYAGQLQRGQAAGTLLWNFSILANCLLCRSDGFLTL